MDIIDRNKLDEVCSRLNADGWGITRNEYKLIERVLLEFPSAEKTGSWVFNPRDGIEAMFTKPKCSVCGFESADGLNYCPNCGARMEVEE